ncbi:probable cytochrome P450 6d5 [Contarinia nasturtii]|uniref:probable cytochrome P450 6d5 n=1 Tax=Contarinia nasturtii TaxID=265458 RepID=UPI0012D46872|nr:probable cytochrome P450 6d5 [Contarinia nasturtii]
MVMVLFSDSLKTDALIVFVGALTLFYWFIRRNYTYWERKGFKTLPGCKYFVGHFKSTVTQIESISNIVLKLYETTNEPFIGFYSLIRPTLMIRDPELARLILIKDFSHFPHRGIHCNEDYDILSGNLVSLPPEKWRNLRAKLTPTFTSGKLKAMFHTLLDCGSTLQSHLEKLANNGELLDVREIAASHATNVIASVGFGIDVDCINDPNNEFRVNGRKIFESTIINAARRLVSVLFPTLMDVLRIKTFHSSIERFIVSIVKQNLDYREQNHVIRKDFFQLLIQLRNTGTVQLDDDQWDTVIKTDEKQKQMTLNEIVAQCFVFFAAGFETSSTTLSFCLYELAKNSEIQQRVHDEIDHILQKFDGQITYESISEMKYLETCIEETLRKYPIVAALPRSCAKDYQIPGTDKIIEKGVEVIVPVAGFHKDKRYYEDPYKFNPDRFNEENSNGKNQINRPYYPFGDGPRNCIAMRMGKMQTKVGLVLMLQKFRFDLLENKQKYKELDFDPKSILLAPKSGIYLRIFKRI